VDVDVGVGVGVLATAADFVTGTGVGLVVALGATLAGSFAPFVRKPHVRVKDCPFALPVTATV
jgi:hypothetical protein